MSALNKDCTYGVQGDAGQRAEVGDLGTDISECSAHPHDCSWEAGMKELNPVKNQNTVLFIPPSTHPTLTLYAHTEAFYKP